MDFTIIEYQKLLQSLLKQNAKFQTLQEFLGKLESKSIILRHDVDKLPQNSLQFAQLQNEWGIQGSYYFRIVPESFNPKIIEQIAELGHEIGYHYETFDIAAKLLKTNYGLRITKSRKKQLSCLKSI